jgi:prepilin-type N-terminal cleavage/methylation domain-containing protein
MKLLQVRRGRPAGFTLIEVLVVITIIAALFALVLGAYSYAQNASKRSATRVRINTIASALENYRQDNGEYPEPANPGGTIDILKLTYEVSGAKMLYQALSGDGDTEINIKSGAEGRESNGNLEQEESEHVVMKDMPRNMWTKMGEEYFMIDGWGRPLQYTKAVDVDPNATAAGGAGAQAPDPVTINGTFDLWSYGQDTENTTAKSVEIETNAELKKDSLQWVTNWQQ